MLKCSVRSEWLGSAAAAVLLSVVFSIPAQAAPATGLFGGGATFPSIQMRDIFNCFGSSGPADGLVTQLEVGLPALPCTGQTGYREDSQVLYLTVGSGLGLTAWKNKNAADLTNGPRTPNNPPVASSSDFGPFYGTGQGSTWVPNGTDAGPFFPRLHFAMSDDPVAAAVLADYNNTADGADNIINTADDPGMGPAWQVPAFIGAIPITYSDASGGGVVWNEKGKKPSGGGNVGLLSLKTPTWCGIWTGAITHWEDPEITADNGGVSITGLGVNTTPITLRYRSDGSGTTFLFVNAMLAQCNSTPHPVPDTWEDAGPNVIGESHNSWFVNVKAAGLLPAHFIGASGNLNVATAVATNPGNMGYNSTDFAQPVFPTGPKPSNLQTWASYFNGTTPVFKAATAANAVKIVTAAATTPHLKAPSFSKTCSSTPQGCATNPLDWSKLAPAPLHTAAFPIGGYTYFLGYTCYQQAADINALASATVGAVGLFNWFFGTEGDVDVDTSLAANRFAPVPNSFETAARKLLITNKPTKIGTPGQASTGCSAVQGPGA